MVKMKLFNTSDIAEQAVAYILAMEDGQIKNLKPEDVAAAINKNLIFLSWIFKIFCRISPGKYILREKLYRAFFALFHT